MVAAVMAACTGPDAALDSTEAKLDTASDIYSNPDYVAARLADLVQFYGPRLTQEEIDGLYAGSITSQEALDMDESEHEELASEMQALFDAAEALFEPAPSGPIAKKDNDDRGPPPKTGDKEVRCDGASYRRCLWFGATVGGITTPAPAWPAVGLAVTYYCVCEHCQGGWVDKVC